MDPDAFCCRAFILGLTLLASRGLYLMGLVRCPGLLLSTTTSLLALQAAIFGAKCNCLNPSEPGLAHRALSLLWRTLAGYLGRTLSQAILTCGKNPL